MPPHVEKQLNSIPVRESQHIRHLNQNNYLIIMKKVIVISTSLRLGSNSHALAEQFAKGAEAAGHQVELVSLRGKEIKFCIGCLSCQKTGACVIKDDVPAIMESVLNADVVCWARHLPADHGCRERGVRAEARRKRSAGLDRLLRQVKS